MKYSLLVVAVAGLLDWSCAKGGHPGFGSIYPTDANGNLVGDIPNDQQWKQRDFSSKEWAFFDALDTTDLSGTAYPGPVDPYYAFPNPYRYSFNIHAGLSQNFSGDIVVKYVMVNSGGKIVLRNARRLPVVNSINFQLGDNISNGRYQVYYTFSAEGKEYFFNTWGYVQKQ